MLVKFRFRRDTASNWAAANPVLALGEPGLETDTRKVKYGDGTTAWNSLAYGGTNGFSATIGVGGATPSASGAGVSFPATQSPSTNPNTLDDYEEGTWTPTVASAVGTITTVGAVAGEYTKIGNLVAASFDVTITTNGTGATWVDVSLPFISGSTLIKEGCGREHAITGNQLQVRVMPGTAIASVQNYNNTYPGGSGNRLVCTVVYTV